jgi:NADH:ubiquinone reductase (H+-translocating)
MPRSTVVIIGAGFAGIAAARVLSHAPDLVDTVVIDRHEHTHFRPLLPDVAGGIIRGRDLLFPCSALARRHGFSFCQGEVAEVDFGARRVHLADRAFDYDFLIVATGSETGFPPGSDFSRHARRLDSVHQANAIREDVRSAVHKRLIVCGGGYTGIELATNLFHLAREQNTGAQVTVVEMLDHLGGALPEWVQRYIEQNVRAMGIGVVLGARVTEVSQTMVRLSNGDEFSDALCLWTTGLGASSLTKAWDLPKGAHGRIAVDLTLRFNEICFAAGDAACVPEGGNCRRMAVQSAIQEGARAARNVLCLIRHKEPRAFHGHDSGFIIPMANGKSCGDLFGIRVKGRGATLLHYAISAWRLHGVKARARVMRAGIRSQWR